MCFSAHAGYQKNYKVDQLFSQTEDIISTFKLNRNFHCIALYRQNSHMKSKIFLFLVILPLKLFCQTSKPDVLASLGGSGYNAEMSMNWTLGEIFINEFSNNDFILAQGFHQGYPGIPSGIIDPFSNSEIKAFPNPVNDILNIYIQNDLATISWRMEVFDSRGVKIIDVYSKASTNEIPFSSLEAGTYMVRVSHNDSSKVFHIIKNDFSHEKN